MRKTISAVLAVILTSLILSACKNETEPVLSPEPEAPTATVTPVTPAEPSQSPVTPSTPDVTTAAPPTITEITPPPGLAEELRGFWGRIDGSTATIPLTAALYDTISGGSLRPVHNTTPDAYQRLIVTKDVDLIFVTYPSENEMSMAKENMTGLEIIPIVKDALVFLVNVENPVDNIKQSQLRDIYTGNIKKWSDVGGKKEDIIPYQRSADSGSQTLFLKLLMKGVEPMEPPSEIQLGAMSELVDAVSFYDNSRYSLGYSMFYYVNNMYGNDRFKLLSIDGAAPTRETIARGEYPLEDGYYAVMRIDTPEDSPARKLVSWLLSDDGQALAVQAGYIPLRPIDNAPPGDIIDPVYIGDTGNSSGTGGTRLKTGVEDVQPVNGVRPPLSDLFYDGFNYIRFINDEIVAQLDSVDNERWYKITWGEEYQLRPFTGIPNDYPNYEINYIGYLYISFPAVNPFFDRGINFIIRLDDTISPYGAGRQDYSVKYYYAGGELPRVDIYAPRLDIIDKPEATTRINAQLEAWIETFPDIDASVKLIGEFIKWYASGSWESTGWRYRLVPEIGQWRDYISVSYILQLFDGPGSHMPMVYTICFEKDTGNTVDLAGVLPDEMDYAGAWLFTPAVFRGLSSGDYPRQEYMPEGYIPAAGSVVTDAWIMYNMLNLLITEPDGRVLQANFWE